MIINILYFIAMCILFINFLSIKKSEQKINIIKWLFISFVILFSLNSVIAYIFSYIGIPSNTLTFSIIYILISVLIYIIFIKNKERQTYYFEKKDLIIIGILFIITMIITYVRFGFPFEISYHTIDPAIHFQSSYSFYKESFLLNFVQDNTIFNYETWRFASYANLGLIFKLVSPIISEANFYNIYIIYDIFTFFLTGVLFFYLINKNNKYSVIKIIGTIVFLLGYPLNNLLIGFFYVGHSSIIIISIMILIDELKKSDFSIYLVALLNTALLFTYYLFIPFVFAAEFIYFIKSKKVIKKYIILFLIPIVLGFIYFILPTFDNSNMNLVKQVKIDGFFYNDVIGNSLLFFPIVSYYIYQNIKEKKLTFETLFFGFLFLFMVLLNILMLCDIIMPYYISKYYYILWIICFVITFKVFDKYFTANKFMFINYGVFILLTIILSMTNLEQKIIDLNEGDWNKTTPTSLFQVYSYNLDVINNPKTVFSVKELKDIKIMSQNLDNNFSTNTEPEKIFWLIDFINKGKVNCPVNQVYDCLESIYIESLEEYINNETSDKYIYFSRSYYWEEEYLDYEKISFINSLDRNLFDVYETSFGYIIEKRMI